jgi:hypothetical protein
LKLVGLDASIEAKLKVAEKIRHLANIGAILNINEVVLTFLSADDAQLTLSVAFGKTDLA